MKIVAFDLSLRRTGIADENGAGTYSPADGDRGMRRLMRIRNVVLQNSIGADLVVLEGYAFARPNQAHQLGELGGVVRLALYENDVGYVDIPPALLKKYATNSGNASKEEMLSQAIQRLEYHGHDHNESDALWLRTMALDRYGLLHGVTLPKSQRASLEKINWPKLTKKYSENIPGEDTAVARGQSLFEFGVPR